MAAAPAARRPECILLTRTGTQKIKWEAGETIMDYNDREVRIRQTLSASEPVTYMTPVNPDGTYGKDGARIVKVQGYDLKNCEECFDLLFD
jgi:FAD/FMN-containing dehydrogenase